MTTKVQNNTEIRLSRVSTWLVIWRSGNDKWQ